MIHITLTPKTISDDPADPLKRTFYGWDEGASAADNWANNRGYWVLGDRARNERYVLFSYNQTHEVVMAAEISSLIDATGKPGRKILEGDLLPEDHPVHNKYVGQSTPPSGRVRNPVTYFDATVGGWPCACGCGTEIFAGDFVRGHDQIALHTRIAQIGSISDFLRWFDALHAGEQPGPPTTTNFRHTGQLKMAAKPDGTVKLTFTPNDD